MPMPECPPLPETVVPLSEAPRRAATVIGAARTPRHQLPNEPA